MFNRQTHSTFNIRNNHTNNIQGTIKDKQEHKMRKLNNILRIGSLTQKNSKG